MILYHQHTDVQSVNNQTLLIWQQYCQEYMIRLYNPKISIVTLAAAQAQYSIIILSYSHALRKQQTLEQRIAHDNPIVSMTTINYNDNTVTYHIYK